MTKLAKAYKMLQTCFIKTGTIIVVHEEFTEGKVYAAKDIPEARLLVWIDEGFCVPADPGAEVTAAATPEQKAEAAEKVAAKKAKDAADAAAKKAAKLAKKKADADQKAEKKAAKDAAETAKKETAAAKKAAKEAEKEVAAAEALAEAEQKAADEQAAEAAAFIEMAKLWDDVPVEDFPRYVEFAEAQGYELDEAPDVKDHAAWLAYFVPFFGEDGPPLLPEVAAE